MNKPSDKRPAQPTPPAADDALTRLIGLGDRSIRKSYYPQLKRKITELETFQLLVDRAADAIFLLRMAPPSIAYANDAAAQMTGLDKEALGETDLVDVFGQKTAAALARDRRTGEDETLLGEQRDRILEYSVSCHVVDNTPYTVVVARDITRRVRTEQELRQLQTLLAGIVESMPSVLIGLSPEGEVTLWNRQAEDMSGILSNDAQGRQLTELIPRLAGQMSYVRRALFEKTPQVQSRVMHHEAGRLCFEDITVYPLLDDDEAVGAVLRIDDVTERVHMDEIMVQSEKMMSVGGLAAGMAHEINNPLGGILQGAQNLSRRLMDDIPANIKVAERLGCSLDDIRAYMTERNIPPILEGIKDSGQRAARIVANMLDFSRKSDSQMAPNDLAQVLDRAVELATSDYNLKKKYDFRKIKLVRDYDPGLPMIRCSATEIEQVVLNLLSNAAHAMADHPEPPGGRRITLSTTYRAESAWIQIEDNGPGMDETTRKQVFEPFFTTKEPGFGTGLGLSVSYYIVTQNHGGEFTVDSAPGRGTRFIIRLPLR